MSDTELIPSDSIAQLASVLGRLGLQYALVGGVAVSLLSTPRFTADIDAVVLDLDERLEHLVGEFEREGLSPRSLDQVAFTRRTRVLTLSDRSGVGVDLMLGVLPFDVDLVARAVATRLNDSTTVPVATVEHIIVMKAVAWRPKDIQDIRELVSVNPTYDRRYVLDTFAEYANLLDVPERVDELKRLLATPA